MKKLSISILLLFVMILSITAVAAADDVTSDLAKSQTADDSIALAVDDGTDVLAADGGNFTQFQKDIDAVASPTITKDYTMKTGEKAVVISKEVRIVGSTIDAAGNGTIFNITSTGKLYLTGVTLKNGNSTNGGAIYNYGEIIIQDANTFSTNNASLGGAIYNNGIITFEGTGAFSADTAKTGSDIYNAKDGQITIGAGSTFEGSIYNEGTLTAGASTYKGEVINNGTIDSITGSINGALTNYGTITTINSNNIAAPITNNGTITNIKGKTTDKITNNGNIGTINATIDTLTNNGAVTTIVDSDVTTLKTNGTIGTINKIKVNNVNNTGTIDSISNSEINIFRNYATVHSIENSTFNYLNANNQSVVVDKINNVTIANNLNILGTYGSIAKITVKNVNVYANATVDSIKDSTIGGALTVYANATVGTIDNVTVVADVTNNGKIDSINNLTFADQIINNVVIGTITALNSTIDEEVPALTNNGNITSIKDVTVITGIYNEGNITSMDNFTGAIGNTVDGVIGTISNSYIGVYNAGNITTISDSIFEEFGVINEGIITSITGSTFNASTIENEGVLAVADSKFFNGERLITNKGNMTISGSSFTNATNIAISNGVERANMTITNSVFTNNTREGAGGAAIYNKGKLEVSASTFENNVAGTYGGAVYNNGVAVITGSTFTNNTASNDKRGNAIYNKGNLTLSGNTINTAHADIVNAKDDGFITSVILTVTNNNTVYNYATPVNLTATLTDADGNWIYDMGAIDFVINGTVVGQPTAYNNTTGVYLLSVALKGKENITNADQTVTANLTAKYVNATATVTDGTLKTIKGTFTELQYLIDNAPEDGLVLPYDFAYNAEFDNVNLTKGVVINKAITIDGNGTTISGNDAARIFFVNASTVTIKNATFTKGLADDGAAIYANASVNVRRSTFDSNVATGNGGAIYSTNGAALMVSDSKFANNMANDTANAIYVDNGYLNEYNNTINTKYAEIVNNNATINYIFTNITVLANKTINVTYGEAVTLNATITDENGNLINDPFFYFTIKSDKFAAIFDVANNVYTADVKLYYAAGNEYEVSVAHKKSTVGAISKFTIKTASYNISKAAPSVVVDIPNVVAGENATVTITLTGANGDGLNATGDDAITVVVNNTEYKVNVTNGTGNITLPVFDLGTYNVFVNYAGDDNYNGSDVATDFAVRTATKMTVTASDVTYDGATIAVTLTDGNGTPLTKFVTVTVDGKDYTVAVTNGAGSQVITGLAANKAYPVTATFAGDADYNEASATTTFSIAAATVTAENIKRGVNSPFDYYVTVTDANGNPIADKEITIYVNGTKYTAKTNATGIATVAAGLTVVNETATVYDVIVVNPDTGANITATTTIVPRIVVLSGDLTADYLENPPYIVQAFGDDGNPVGEGEIVTVVFSGYFYYMPTNATGHVVRTIGLAPGLYAVKAGYKDYNATATIFSVKQILTASSGTLKKTAKSYTLKATLKNTNGKAIAGKEVKLTFNGKTYKVKTNSKGVASYTIKSSVISKLTAGKTYKLTAKYVNDLTKGKYVGKIKVVKK